MKKLLVAMAMIGCGIITSATDKNVPTPSRYESFEQGIPKNWILQGKGKLSTNPWHYKLGKKSLQWDFKAGDAIRINNTLGNIRRRGGLGNYCFPAMCVWVYAEQPMPGKNLRFEFRVGEKSHAYFDFPLNFKGWQCGFPMYNNMTTANSLKKTFIGTVSAETDNILIKAPENSDGCVLMDCVIYNGLVYYWNNFLPRKTPWQPTKLDETKYPEPQKLAVADLRAMDKIQKELLPQVKFATSGKGVNTSENVLKLIKSLNIVEDAHGIRGRPIPFLRGHGNGILETRWMYEENGIDISNTIEIAEIRRGRQRNYGKNAIILNATSALKKGVSKSQFSELSAQHALMWKYLLDQGFNTSYGGRSDHRRCPGQYLQLAYLLRDGLFKQGIMPQVVNYLQMGCYDLFAPPTKETNMDYFLGSRIYYLLAFLNSNDPKVQAQSLKFIAGKLSTEICADNGPTGFKVDGIGYHCTSAGGSYTREALGTLSMICKATSGSSFALSPEAFERLKKTILNFYLCSSKLEKNLHAQGAHVTYLVTFNIAGTLKNFALGRPDGKLDNDLAQAYVNLKKAMPIGQYDDIFERKYNIKPSEAPEGNWSMPSAFRMAHRRDNWLAVTHAGGTDIRANWNRFGRYISTGLLEILGKDGFFASGNVYNGLGFDWNRIDGTTVIYYPLEKLRPTEKGNMRQDLRHEFIGGMSWRGVNGCFAAQLGRTEKCKSFDQSFDGKKSYFFINDRIYALGSDIHCTDKGHKVQTNLYQKALFTTTIPPTFSHLKIPPPEIKISKYLNEPTFVDGEKITAFPVSDQALKPQKGHYLLDTVGNGYYVPSGQNVLYARKEQKSRHATDGDKERRRWVIGDTQGEYATAWIDHGFAPENAKYTYVVLPYCGEKKLAQFAGKADSSKAFEVLQLDGFAHVLHDKTDGFYGAVFFKGGNVAKLPHVVNVERACQVMYREKDGHLEIAVGDPDLHRKPTKEFCFGAYGGRSKLTPLKVTFSGSWKLEKPIDGVRVLSSDKDKTVLEFACIHGRDFNFTLIKREKL